jgi:hypothetical protein
MNFEKNPNQPMFISSTVITDRSHIVEIGDVVSVYCNDELLTALVCQTSPNIAVKMLTTQIDQELIGKVVCIEMANIFGVFKRHPTT